MLFFQAKYSISFCIYFRSYADVLTCSMHDFVFEFTINFCIRLLSFVYYICSLLRLCKHLLVITNQLRQISCLSKTNKNIFEQISTEWIIQEFLRHFSVARTKSTQNTAIISSILDYSQRDLVDDTGKFVHFTILFNVMFVYFFVKA